MFNFPVKQSKAVLTVFPDKTPPEAYEIGQQLYLFCSVQVRPVLTAYSESNQQVGNFINGRIFDYLSTHLFICLLKPP